MWPAGSIGPQCLAGHNWNKVALIFTKFGMHIVPIILDIAFISAAELFQTPPRGFIGLIYNPQSNVTLNCEGIVNTSIDDVIGHVTTCHFRHFTGMELFETPPRGFNRSTSNLVSEIS